MEIMLSKVYAYMYIDERKVPRGRYIIDKIIIYIYITNSINSPQKSISAVFFFTKIPGDLLNMGCPYIVKN